MHVIFSSFLYFQLTFNFNYIFTVVSQEVGVSHGTTELLFFFNVSRSVLFC